MYCYVIYEIRPPTNTYKRFYYQGVSADILRMREDGLSDSSINSYTRTLKVFFSWCNEQGYTKSNLKIYKIVLLLISAMVVIWQ